MNVQLMKDFSKYRAGYIALIFLTDIFDRITFWPCLAIKQMPVHSKSLVLVLSNNQVLV